MKQMMAAGIAGLLAAAAPAGAQVSLINPEVAAELRGLGSYGPDVPARTSQLFGQLHETMPRDGVRVETDIAYGEHERNTLDLFVPEDAAGEAPPILVFAHGGGYVRGDKSGASNVGYYFARNGVVAATINYRLAPEHTWPSGIEDFAAVIEWLRDNEDVHGGNTNAIFLAGTSAGAGHAAGYVFHDELQLEDDGVAGAILFAIPSVDLTGREIDPERDALYFGTDQEQLAERSIISNLEGREIPLLITVAEFDPPLVHEQTSQLVAGLFDRDGRLPHLLTALGHNHFSIASHINTGDEILSLQILEFIFVHAK